MRALAACRPSRRDGAPYTTVSVPREQHAATPAERLGSRSTRINQWLGAKFRTDPSQVHSCLQGPSCCNRPPLLTNCWELLPASSHAVLSLGSRTCNVLLHAQVVAFLVHQQNRAQANDTLRVLGRGAERLQLTGLPTCIGFNMVPDLFSDEPSVVALFHHSSNSYCGGKSCKRATGQRPQHAPPAHVAGLDRPGVPCKSSSGFCACLRSISPHRAVQRTLRQRGLRRAEGAAVRAGSVFQLRSRLRNAIRKPARACWHSWAPAGAWSTTTATGAATPGASR